MVAEIGRNITDSQAPIRITMIAVRLNRILEWFAMLLVEAKAFLVDGLVHRSPDGKAKEK